MEEQHPEKPLAEHEYHRVLVPQIAPGGSPGGSKVGRRHLSVLQVQSQPFRLFSTHSQDAVLVAHEPAAYFVELADAELELADAEAADAELEPDIEPAETERDVVELMERVTEVETSNVALGLTSRCCSIFMVGAGGCVGVLRFLLLVRGVPSAKYNPGCVAKKPKLHTGSTPPPSWASRVARPTHKMPLRDKCVHIWYQAALSGCLGAGGRALPEGARQQRLSFGDHTS